MPKLTCLDEKNIISLISIIIFQLNLQLQKKTRNFVL